MRRASLKRLGAPRPELDLNAPSPRFGRPALRLAAGAAALLALAACEPIVRTHGYAPQAAQLEQIQVGVDGPGEVAGKIGRPSTSGVVRNDVWYYAGSVVETWAYEAPQVTERRVVAVRFGQDQRVSGIDVYGLEDGRVVNLVTRTTPTFGRELTVLQQLFGNIANVGATLSDNLATE